MFVSAGANDPGCYAPTLVSGRRTMYTMVGGRYDNPVVVPDQPFGLCEFGHQGLMYEEHLNNHLMDVRHRIYNVALARWNQEDPKQYDDGPNVYLYNKSNPIFYNDPQGLIANPYKCCGGKQYHPFYKCCENNAIVDKVDIWIRERPLREFPSASYYFGGVWMCMPYFWQPIHSYVCCDGPNKNCFGKQKKDDGGIPCKAGDPIPREINYAVGSCRLKKVCPSVKDENAIIQKPLPIIVWRWIIVIIGPGKE